MKTLGVLILVLVLFSISPIWADHVKSITLLPLDKDDWPIYPFEELENTSWQNPIDLKAVPIEQKSISPWHETKILDTGGADEEGWISEVDHISYYEIAWKQFGIFSGEYRIYLGKSGKQTKKIVLDMLRTSGMHTYKIGRKLNQQTEFYLDGELVYITPLDQLFRTKFVQTFLSYWSNPVGVSEQTVLFSGTNYGWKYEEITAEYKANGFVKLHGPPGLRPIVRLQAESGTLDSPLITSWFLLGNFSDTGESCHYIPNFPTDIKKLSTDTTGLSIFKSAW